MGARCLLSPVQPLTGLGEACFCLPSTLQSTPVLLSGESHQRHPYFLQGMSPSGMDCSQGPAGLQGYRSPLAGPVSLVIPFL